MILLHQRYGAVALNLPLRFAEATFATLPKGSDVRKVTRSYLKQFAEVANRGIAPLYVGPAETWKSFAAAVVARYAFSVGVGFEWVNCPEQFSRMSMQRFDKKSADVVARWSRIPLLIMDDFAVMRPEPFMLSILQGIVAARFDAVLPTIWTGNLVLTEGTEWEQVTTLYGPLFTRRLKAGSEGFRVVSA